MCPLFFASCLIEKDDTVYPRKVQRRWKEEANSEILSAFNSIDPYVLRARIKSRYSGSRSYYTYIVVDRAIQGRQAILG